MAQSLRLIIDCFNFNVSWAGGGETTVNDFMVGFELKCQIRTVQNGQRGIGAEYQARLMIEMLYPDTFKCKFAVGVDNLIFLRLIVGKKIILPISVSVAVI